MKNLMAPNIPLALVLLAAVAAVALRALTRRPEPSEAPGTAAVPVAVIARQRRSQPQPVLTTGRHEGTGGEMASPPAHPGWQANAVDQAQHIFHELHADGRHSSCAVCDSQYGAA
jgi:hypothetical protein